MILIKADGTEITTKIADVSVSSNNEDQLLLEIKGAKYLMRINSLDVNEESGRYLNLDLLFAALNQYTTAIYIKGDQPQA